MGFGIIGSILFAFGVMTALDLTSAVVKSEFTGKPISSYSDYEYRSSERDERDTP